jgi:endonuclease YncB( thermonuclease family)
MRLLIAVLLGGLAAALSVTSTGASATAVTAADAAHATATSPVPTSVVGRIRAEYGQAALLPTFAPASFIYTSWRVDPASPSYLMDALSVTFAHNGTRLIWSVSDGRDEYGGCSSKAKHDLSRRIGSRLVHYGRGNHGDDAWTCLTLPPSNGFRQRVGVDLWIENATGRPSPATAMRMVAGGRLAGSPERVGGTAEAPLARVASVYDGDTLTLSNRKKVRLVQIDTPELGSGECYSRAARTALLSLVPVGSRVALEQDPALDKVDRYGRLLRYIRGSGVNVNLELVRRGAATPYFYKGDRGRYANQLVQAARTAKAAKRGLWGACPGTILDPIHAADTGVSSPPTKPPPPTTTSTPVTTTAPAPTTTSPAPPPPPTTTTPPANCAASYPDVCIPPPPPDLDCKDIPFRQFRVIYSVPSPDPHRFDGDHDGVGCES